MRPKIYDFEPDDGGISEAFGTIATIVGGLDVVGWLTLSALALISADTDPATRGFGFSSAWIISALFVLTAVPSLLLSWRGGKGRLALILAGAFPLGFMLIYGGLTIAFG